MTPVTVTRGAGSVVLGLPHTGTFVPVAIATNLNANGRKLADTDWHIDRLYDGLLHGVTTVRANFHRYVIDANRDPEGHSLYPGQNTTSLVPLTDFDGADIWETPPTADEVEARRAAYHAPYHAALRAELDRVRALHGHVILYDCHSIRSDIPFLFEGRLPVFNIGTNLGATCDPRIEHIVEDIARGSGQETVLNARFKGGWTTRHYGRPEEGLHAIQMEIAQRAYLEMEAPPWAYAPPKARRTQAVLRPILTSLGYWRPLT